MNRTSFKKITAVFCFLAVSLALTVSAGDVSWDPAENLIVFVRNRLYPNFREIHETDMNQRIQVGDTDYFFEVVEFYPHFALIDSTKEAVSLSSEPENVAFKFVVYENDSIVDTSWSFYHIQIPHYAANSSLVFDVFKFDYRGESFQKDSE
jgi:hypothetical protein